LFLVFQIHHNPIFDVFAAISRGGYAVDLTVSVFFFVCIFDFLLIKIRCSF